MRQVKLGRKAMIGSPVAYHWAVQVGDTWYEIDGGKNSPNSVTKHKGSAAASWAGLFGGELVGETNATNDEIKKWIDRWLDTNPDYEALTANCQKFAYEFMEWLTDGNFICSHRFNAADTTSNNDVNIRSFRRAEDGNAVARISDAEARKSYAYGSVSSRALHVQAQAVAGPGLGAWVDASFSKFEASFGNVVGAHFEPNVNTGVGVRNGNVDVHLLGFGGKIGADGIELNTPLGGVNACSVM